MENGVVRRVVTGHRNGKAVVISDELCPNVARPQHRPGVVMNNVWFTDGAPANLTDERDPTKGVTVTLEPPKGGASFRVVSFSPEKSWIHTVTREAARATFATLGAGHAPVKDENPPHPLMHKTKTIDYAIVLSGEIWMVLDDSEVQLKAGDTIIQRGTNHAWSNRSDEPCVIAFVLIDGEF
jgi:mannose-6-phosphate isomerase-like protein (cupin superfamily)